MAVSQADIDALNAAIASGVRSATLGGQTVIFNTSDSLIKARDDLMRQKAAEDAAASGNRRPKQTYAYHAGRGY